MDILRAVVRPAPLTNQVTEHRRADLFHVAMMQGGECEL